MHEYGEQLRGVRGAEDPLSVGDTDQCGTGVSGSPGAHDARMVSMMINALTHFWFIPSGG